MKNDMMGAVLAANGSVSRLACSGMETGQGRR